VSADALVNQLATDLSPDVRIPSLQLGDTQQLPAFQVRCIDAERALEELDRELKVRLSQENVRFLYRISCRPVWKGVRRAPPMRLGASGAVDEPAAGC
jgi:hypothetical protein